MNPTCETCRWWEPVDPPATFHRGSVGQCKRHAPEHYIDLKRNNVLTWPITIRVQWCGDHRPQ